MGSSSDLPKADVVPEEKPLKRIPWSEVHKHNTRDDCWLVIRGKIYDVTPFVPKHPGGDMILQGAGRDATALFMSYHPTRMIPSSASASNMIIGQVADYNPFYSWESEFYTTLKRRVGECIQEKNLVSGSNELYIKTFLMFTIWFICYYYGMIQGSIIFTFLLGFFHAQVGLSTAHDGGHGAYSRNKRINQLAKYVIDVMGGSHITWSVQHNIGHHPNCNRQGEFENEEYDPDARSGSPMLRFSPQIPLKPYHKFQYIYVWALFPFAGAKWIYTDIKYIMKRKYQNIDFWDIPKTSLRNHLLIKSLFVLYSTIIPIYLHGFLKGITLSAIIYAIHSLTMSVLFSVNHLTETVFPEKDFHERDWAKLQVMTSSNFAMDSMLWRWIAGGLNYQIEHHLFPSLNHMHLPHIQPIVKQTCKQYGVPYIVYDSLWSALDSYTKHLWRMGQPNKLEKSN